MSGCNLTGGFGLMVQGLLFTICGMALLYKRHIEKPRRSFLIFTLDLSKQGFAQMSVHFANIFISKTITHECSSYLFISTFDTIFGLILNYLLLMVVNKIADTYGFKHLLSGNYFSDPNAPNVPGKDVLQNDPHAHDKQLKDIKINYKIWFSQVLMWVFIVLSSKVVLYMCEIRLQVMIDIIHNLLEALPMNVKIVFVLVIAPAIMNCVLVWIQDNLLKKSKFTQEERENLYNFFYEGESIFGDESQICKAQTSGTTADTGKEMSFENSNGYNENMTRNDLESPELQLNASLTHEMQVDKDDKDQTTLKS